MQVERSARRNRAVGLYPLRFRHVLMLALAFEVMVLGVRGAQAYRPRGIAVEQSVMTGHIIT